MSTGKLGEVLERHAAGLVSLPGVIGTAEGRTGDGAACVLLLLAAAPEDTSAYPAFVEEHPVRLRVIGAPEAREEGES